MDDDPKVCMARVRGAVLAAIGSAQGIDGIPYEMYHDGVAFNAELIVEALSAAADGAHTLQKMIGQPEDSPYFGFPSRTQHLDHPHRGRCNCKG